MLGALIIVARHRGVHISVGQLVHDHLLRPGDITWDATAQLARASGLRATTAKFAWSDMVKLGNAAPVVVRLTSGYAMVLLRVEKEATSPV